MSFVRSLSVRDALFASVAATAVLSADIIRDPAVAPLSYSFLDFGTLRSPSESTTEAFSTRFVGPLPIDLPGGRPSLHLLFERTEVWNGESEFYQNTAASSVILFTPDRWQNAPAPPPAGPSIGWGFQAVSWTRRSGAA
ncbi:hypothetical protein [Brevundimonas sp.]|uniref:hypothetical protein n=1 Tax=Brevundimonas sp. TaxID=1871086 RepID=UPI001D3E4367|nr:hypothetical protein [Brevundimonas sp.]MBA4000067.1 hypothetical protein [Brevundimonas sp.]